MYYCLRAPQKYTKHASHTFGLVGEMGATINVGANGEGGLPGSSTQIHESLGMSIGMWKLSSKRVFEEGVLVFKGAAEINQAHLHIILA